MDLATDIEVYESIVRKITLLRVLAVLLVAQVVIIVASSEDARRK